MTPTVLHKAKGRRRHHDPASRAFAVAPLTAPTRSWNHAMGPVLNQAKISGCTGWSGADLLNSAKFLAARKLYNAARHPGAHPQSYLTDADGLWIYEQATQNDDLGWTYPPTDNGSTGLGVVKALQNIGVIGKYEWAFDFATMLAYAARHPIMLGTLWTDAMMEPDALGIIHTGGAAAIKKADNDGEGHEYCLRGVNLKTKRGKIRNHWTRGWGINGDAWIDLTELETLLITYHGDAVVPELIGTP